MPVEPSDPSAAPHGVGHPIARAAAGAARAAARQRAETDDFLMADDARLDEASRVALAALLGALLLPIERELRLGAARRLAEWGAEAHAEHLLADAAPVQPRLARARVLADAELMEELLGRCRLDRLAERLAPLPRAGDEPSLLVRLIDCPEPAVADAARVLIEAENVRRDDSGAGGLPAELQHRLAWWTAAALRERLAEDARADHALIDAAHALLADHDEGGRVEAAAMRLAAVLDARPEELPALLPEVLGEGRPVLFVALLAQACALPFATVRGITVDPDGASLWLLLRSQGFDRTTVAAIGVALAAADPRRDLERLAYDADAIETVSAEDAAAAFAPLALDPDYRRAVRALGGRR